MTSFRLPDWSSCGPLPKWVAVIQVVMATVIIGPALVHLGIALPGQPGLADLPGTVNFHWLIQTQGLSEAGQSTLLMHPASLNRILLDGIPLDALASWPFTVTLGWPAGFTVFVWLTFALLGLSMAWLAQGWWGSPIAAAVAGVVAQTHPFLIREVSFGRPTQVFGTIFLPLALGFTLKRLSSGSRADGLLAGACWGLGALAYWFYGVYFGLGIALLLVAARKSAALLPAALEIVGGLALVTAWPLTSVLNAEGSVPGQGLTLDSMVTHGDHELSLRQLIEFRDLGESILTDRVLAAQILVVLLAGWAIRRLPSQQWSLPAAWFGAAVLMAAGPAINLPGGLDLPGPFLVFDLTDLTRRNWWPDRALVLAVPAFALLAAGGAKALVQSQKPNRPSVATAVLCGLLLAEAFLVIPGLPMSTTWGAENPKTRQLAEGTGPTLILPIGSNGDQPDARMMIDQIHHGRPLVNGPMPYTSSTAPADYAAAAASDGLASLLRCESGSQPDPARAQTTWPALQKWGVTEVFLDRTLASRMRVDAQRYERCIASVLGESEGGDPMLRFEP